ncbi:hypothetical protein I302_103792 [Kwoniella bestiolae CBS 10118]|uniref:Phosphatidylglycerol/phosphatidylinositol transfer protein n=1 Tax=Kwoniella bestiolae CBS 10118 TaxID=1296100 RepID=A0A1B9G9E2_9TREE|nr:hypothetical protein I302_02496 [Kwoniella bestiolae CBS 10118]OCF27652.1 hypothetical protein I302_02496 [Kwoniella bestiolae CBS 10118]
MFSTRSIIALVAVLPALGALAVPEATVAPKEKRQSDNEPSSTISEAAEATGLSTSASASSSRNAFAGIIASYAGDIAREQAQGEYGDLVVQMGPFTCAFNGSPKKCNKDQPNNYISLINPNPNDTVWKHSWKFFSYLNANSSDWPDDQPVTSITCDLTLSPGKKGDNATIQIGNSAPYVKEVDPKEMLKMECFGSRDDWVVDQA